MAFAVLVDLVGHGFEAPILGVQDRAIVVFENLCEVLDEPFGLRVRDVLARNKDVLVESHAVTLLSGGFQNASKAPSSSHTRGPAIEDLRKVSRLYSAAFKWQHESTSFVGGEGGATRGRGPGGGM